MLFEIFLVIVATQIPLYIFAAAIWRRVMICDAFIASVRSIECIGAFLDYAQQNQETEHRSEHKTAIINTVREVANEVGVLIDSDAPEQHVDEALRRYDPVVDKLADVIACDNVLAGTQKIIAEMMHYTMGPRS